MPHLKWQRRLSTILNKHKKPDRIMTFYTAQKALNICHVSTLRNSKNSMCIIKIKTDHLILNKKTL
jgi:hypothetical protein